MQVFVSKLSLIKTLKDFHHADKILLVDVWKMNELPLFAKNIFINQGTAFYFNNDFYTVITFSGSPKKLSTKFSKGLPFTPIPGISFAIYDDGPISVEKFIEEKKLYDYSAFYYNMDNHSIQMEKEFLIDRFIKPYIK